MSSLDIALKYLDIFYSGQNLERLYDILADDLIFEGPLYQFDSAHDYIDSLLDGPPVGFEYKILMSFESGSSVNLIYEFSKADITTPMSQLFEIDNNKITKILLIFDTQRFT